MPHGDELPGNRRKRRTRGHVIEDLSQNYLERKVLLRGHVLRRSARDYGVDVVMFHFAEDGSLESGEVRFQLKATDDVKVIKQGTTISLPIKTRDLHYWSLEVYPFILVLFDAKAERAFWLDVQEYVNRHPGAVDFDKATVNIHVPMANSLTVKTVEAFRQKSLNVVADLKSQGGFFDAKRKAK